MNPIFQFKVQWSVNWLSNPVGCRQQAKGIYSSSSSSWLDENVFVGICRRRQGCHVSVLLRNYWLQFVELEENPLAHACGQTNERPGKWQHLLSKLEKLFCSAMSSTSSVCLIDPYYRQLTSERERLLGKWNVKPCLVFTLFSGQ